MKRHDCHENLFSTTPQRVISMLIRGPQFDDGGVKQCVICCMKQNGSKSIRFQSLFI